VSIPDHLKFKQTVQKFWVDQKIQTPPILSGPIPNYRPLFSQTQSQSQSQTQINKKTYQKYFSFLELQSNLENTSQHMLFRGLNQMYQWILFLNKEFHLPRDMVLDFQLVELVYEQPMSINHIPMQYPIPIS
jgi:hypothetical protein